VYLLLRRVFVQSISLVLNIDRLGRLFVLTVVLSVCCVYAMSGLLVFFAK
jgi:hypothetical protein